jgi:hypothetical protein
MVWNFVLLILSLSARKKELLGTIPYDIRVSKMVWRSA